MFRFRPLALVLALPLFLTPSLYGQMRGSFNAEFSTARVQLNLRGSFGSTGYSNYGRTFPIDELRDVVRSEDLITFKLVRPAGTFEFEGRDDDRRVTGRFVFTPNASYQKQLEGMGFSGLTEDRLFVFAMGSLSVADVRFLEQQTEDRLTTGVIIEMVNHGVDVDFVKGLSDAGFKGLSSNELIRTRDHGVNPDYIAALRAQGYRLTLAQYVYARDHGVTERYASEMRALGFAASFDDIVKARDHGVGPDYIGEFKQLGYDLSLSDYIELRDHGVSSDFALEMKELGYKASSEELIRMRNHAVTAGFVRRVNQERRVMVPIAELVRLKSIGY